MISCKFAQSGEFFSLAGVFQFSKTRFKFIINGNSEPSETNAAVLLIRV